jgi:hypothetical protein
VHPRRILLIHPATRVGAQEDRRLKFVGLHQQLERRRILVDGELARGRQHLMNSRTRHMRS